MPPRNDSPECRYWFPAKCYGWGWGPPRVWQGWAVYAVYATLLVVIILTTRPDMNPAAFTVALGGLSVGLLVTCWLKGEPPRWRWGS